MSTPTPVLPTNTPKWVNNFVKFLLVAVPTVLAIWKPGHAFDTATAQAVIVSVGVFLAATVHIAEIVIDAIKAHGLSRATLDRVYTSSQQWVADNISDIRISAYKLKQFLASVPVIQPLLASATGRLTTVESDVSDLKARYATIPGVDQEAIAAIVRDELKKLLGSVTAGPSAVNVAVAPPAVPPAAAPAPPDTIVGVATGV